MRALLIGNYGVGNLGDEALKAYFLSAYPEVSWTVACGRPGAGELPLLPAGLRSWRRPWWKTLRVIRTADVLVFGGGTLFTDIESVRACILWGIQAAVGRWFGRPIFLTFQGVGPFRTGLGRAITRWVLRQAAFVSVRDEPSAVVVQALSPETKVIQTFDPVILASEQSIEPSRTQDMIGIIPRGNTTESFRETVLATARDHPTAELRIVLLQGEDARERDAAARLRVLLPGRKVVMTSVQTFPELVAALAGATRVVTQRYHGAIGALAAGIPFEAVPLAQGDKLDALQKTDLSALKQKAKEGEEALRIALQQLAAPREGEPAPSFEAPDQQGVVHCLEDAKGQWLVLYFYPEDDTSGCTLEACGFRDAYEAFSGKALVLGVSKDSQESHSAFAEKYTLPFPLLADPEKRMINAYGALKGVLGKRVTFLIRPDGTIAKIYRNVDAAPHAAEILRDLETLR